MRKLVQFILMFTAGLCHGSEARQWAAARLDGSADPPFSFTYGGKPSASLLNTWGVKRNQRKLDRNRTEREITYRDAATGLVVRAVVVEYDDFPTVEWTLYFRNEGTADTPILADIEALDATFERTAPGEFILHHHVGSPARMNDYEPLQTVLGPLASLELKTSGGRSSNAVFPYFNLEWGGRGVMMAVGWVGQWAADFTRGGEQRKLRVRAGQELTHFLLHPGEEVRSPLIALQFWTGDRVDAQNAWRRWMLAHNVPRVDAKPFQPMFAAASSLQFSEMEKADEENQKLFIDRYLAEGIKLDYWWMDAGWYRNRTGWPNTGTWEVDKARFPRGLRAISDHAHARGVKVLLWFEPERVTAGTWLDEHHPEWLLSGPGKHKLLNLGNHAARDWVIDMVDSTLTREAVDLYRQDFNMDPLEYWRRNDPEDRQGITEIKHVTGLLHFWDELRRRHPGMVIDTCASGGRRNDLDSLRRAVPLHRSDHIFEPVSQQAQTYGIASWIPYFGMPETGNDRYNFRSNMGPHSRYSMDMRRQDQDFALMRRLYEQWRSVADDYLGDYYPLTPYSLANDVWMAWQFDRPQASRGIVQAFRRAESVYETARFKLRGLTADASYEVADLDRPGARILTGRELMERGLAIDIENRPDAVVLVYKRVPSAR